MTAVSGQLSAVSRLPETKPGTKSILVWLLATIFLATALVAEAQQPKKLTRIGYISSRDPSHESGRAEGIRLALRELGYIEGQNIDFEYRYSEGKTDRASELVTDLMRLKVDIMVIAGGERQRMRPRRFPSLWWAPGTTPLRQA